MSFLDTDPSRSTQEILNDVRAAAANQSHMPGLPLVPASTLLVKIRGEMGQSIEDLKKLITALDEKNGKLQRAMVWLTVVTVLATLVQVGLATVPFFRG